MENRNTRGVTELKSLKNQVTDLAIRLAFWLILITFIISFALPLLGDVIGGLYLDFREYFVDAPTKEKVGLTFFGLF